MMKKGVSVIELLVVIAIVSILAAMAVPAYNRYRGVTAVGVAVETLYSFAQPALATYEQTGHWPATLSFGSQTVAQTFDGVLGGWVLINQNNIASIGYIVSADGMGMAVAATVLNLHGAENYIAPSTTVGEIGAPGNGYIGANTIAIGYREINGVMVTLCGGLDHQALGNIQIDDNYVPPSCTCQWVMDLVNYGHNYCTQ